MKFLFFNIRNQAAIDEPNAPPEVTNVVLPLPIDEALRHVENVANNESLWRVESVDNEAKTIHLTHRTRYLRFVDDVRLRLEEVEGGTRLHGTSVGRMGLYDFGGNLRNLRELVRALKRTVNRGP